MAELWQVAASPFKTDGKGRKRGRPAHYKRPEELWEDFTRYRKWVAENPIQVYLDKDEYSDEISDEKVGTPQRPGASRRHERKSSRKRSNHRRRPLTLYSFCAFAGIPKWTDFKASYRNKPDFSAVIARVENDVAADQVEGATAHIYDPNIVSRLNGLREHVDLDTTVRPEAALPELDKEDIDWLLKHRDD